MALQCFSIKKEFDFDATNKEIAVTKAKIEENCNFIIALFKNKSHALTAKELDTHMVRLKFNLGEIQKTYEQVVSSLKENHAAICHIKPQKFKMTCAVVSAFSFIVAFVALVIKEVSDIVDIKKTWKWVGFTFCFLGIVVSKIADQCLLTVEANQRKLEELKSECLSIMTSAKITLRVLAKYQEDMSKKESAINEMRKRSRTSRYLDDDISELTLYGGLNSTKELVETVRPEFKGFRRSGIFSSWKKNLLKSSESIESISVEKIEEPLNKEIIKEPPQLTSIKEDNKLKEAIQELKDLDPENNASTLSSKSEKNAEIEIVFAS